jgi:glycine/D-amino acid oxidase-like deaminating enzyme
VGEAECTAASAARVIAARSASTAIVGGGVVGLTTSMLLADDGHEVTLLERDPAPVAEPSDAWESWRRRGVARFRLSHFGASPPEDAPSTGCSERAQEPRLPAPYAPHSME